MTNKSYIEKLFKTHYAQLYQLARALLHDDESSRDIVHDVFTHILYSDIPTAPSAGYLITAVRNRCLNRIRDIGTRDRITNLYFLENEDYYTEDWPDEATITRIYQIIKEDLTPQCRRVMQLRFVDGLTFAKVAATLGISENAVYKHVRQALVIIRKNLSQNG